MASTKRRKFNRVSDWHNLVAEIAKDPDRKVDLNGLRRSCYSDIEKLRGRPLLVYAVHFPDAHPKAPISIDQNDVDGFIDLVDAVHGSDEVDVLLHSPGGSPEATERIVAVLRGAFKQVYFLIPHSAFSAATMLALSGNEIILHPTAALGPIDPQINGIPARSIRRGFDKVREVLRDQGPEALPAYLPLIEKYSLELLELCDDSLKLSQELVSEWLKKYMFATENDCTSTIEAAVQFFSNYDEHKTHSRPLTFDKLSSLNLRIVLAEPPLRELIREAYILLNGFFSVSTFIKVYEDNRGLSWGRQFQVTPTPTGTTPPAANVVTDCLMPLDGVAHRGFALSTISTQNYYYPPSLL